MTKNIETILEILKNEVDGDVNSALQKMSNNYSMTWMYKHKDILFPESKKDIKADLEEIYHIKGRMYEIKNIAEAENLVMVELIESYPDPETKKMYRTPLVLVLELENGKITRGRHYCDPHLSYEGLSSDVLEKAYKESPTKVVIK